MKLAITACASALALLGCSGKKDDADKDKGKAPVAMTDAAGAAGTCEERTDALRTWLQSLAADGHRPYTGRVQLAKADGLPPQGVIMPSHTIVISPDEITVDGTLLGVTSSAKPADVVTGVAERVEGGTGGTVLLVIGETAPWSAVAAALTGAAKAKRRRVGIAFAAGAPGKAEPPPKSSIDAELDALAKPGDPTKVAAKLADPPADGGVAGKVFRDCPEPAAMPDLSKLDPDQRDVAIVDLLPRRILACGCKVEFAAVQRLMWSWWDRDAGDAVAVIPVDLATSPKDGTKVTAKPTAPWSEAGKLVIAAAEQGKPIAPQ